MKIVLIHGQNHKGSSYTIGRKIANKISCEKNITEFFLPRDLNHFCLGCYNCVEDEEKCPYYSEKHRIMEESILSSLGHRNNLRYPEKQAAIREVCRTLSRCSFAGILCHDVCIKLHTERRSP
ncbi:nADPH-dependent FMN reductase [Ruminococcus sp. CAG:624]|nr:nADPH-dependent FMN reductase [Ruminococcus sp. CAG:624]